MTLVRLVAGAMTVAALVISLKTTSASAASLAGMKWKSRPVIVFAKDQDERLLKQQRSYFDAASKDLKERDIAVIYVTGSRSSNSDSAERLRAKYGVAADEFKVLLIGKDGGVKRASGRPLSVEQLSATVDAMPMRRQEMRR